MTIYWRYDRSEWEADLCRGRELVRVVECDAALLSEARRQFDQIDQQILTVYIRENSRPSVPAQPLNRSCRGRGDEPRPRKDSVRDP